MDVSVFGLGYVGCVFSACLSRGGHDVIGVDVNPEKVRALDSGRSPIDETGVGDLIEEGVVDGRIRATTDAAEAIANSTHSFVTVGTPLDDTGQLNTTNLYNVMDSIAGPIGEKGEHTVVIRSTVPPRTTRNLREYLDDKLGAEATANFVVNPEFLREGTAVRDFYDPPYVVLGTFEGDDASGVQELYESLGVEADVRVVSPEVAESLKMVNNAFHALKICFANEVGSVASSAGVDGKELMALVCRDTKLNISEKYLEPGFAFGGSCLPKDSRAIAKTGNGEGVDTPLLENILESNERHIGRVSERVNALDGETVGIVGISFKSGTSDMRNSPGLKLAKRLEKDVLLYGGGVDLSGMIGSNRDYVDRTFPDLESRLIEDPDEFLAHVDVVVFTNDDPRPELSPGLESKTVCDPVGAVSELADDVDEYHSITW